MKKLYRFRKVRVVGRGAHPVVLRSGLVRLKLAKSEWPMVALLYRAWGISSRADASWAWSVIAAAGLRSELASIEAEKREGVKAAGA